MAAFAAILLSPASVKHTTRLGNEDSQQPAWWRPVDPDCGEEKMGRKQDG